MFWRAFILAFALLTSPALAQEPAVITVTGRADVAAVPDIARFTLGVVARAPEATSALNEMSTKATAVLTQLEATGIAERDIQTSGLSLDLETDYDPETRRSVVLGYRASTQITVIVRDFDALGPILGEVVTAGASDLGQLRFDVADPEPLLARARAAAMADARTRAGQLAAAVGLALGPVVSITEGSAQVASPRPMDMAMRAEAVPVAAGEMRFAASATVVWALIPAE